MCCPLAAFAVSFSPLKGDYVGRAALERQHAAYRAHPAARLLAHRRPAPAHPAGRGDRPRHRPAGFRVHRDGEAVGWVTSGTVVPYWIVDGDGLRSSLTEDQRAAFHRARLPRQRHHRGRRRAGRRPRPARARPGRPLPPAQRRAAVRPAHRLGPRARAARAVARRRAAASGAAARPPRSAITSGARTSASTSSLPR